MELYSRSKSENLKLFFNYSIAIQHRQWNKSGKPTRTYNPVSFEKWFLLGIRRQEMKGAEFTFFCLGLIRIQWPEKVAMLRTLQDFKREYETEYLSKF
jgi:hypothetical protein